MGRVAKVARVKVRPSPWAGPAVTAVAGVVAAFLFLTALTVPGVAQTTADKNRIDQQISELKEQVTEASREEARLLGLIQASNARKRDLDAKGAAFDRQIASVTRQLDAAQTRLTALERQQRETEARLEAARQELTVARTELQRQAIAAYTGQTEAARYAGLLLEAADADDLATKRSYLKAAVGSQTDAVAEDERLRDQVADLRDALSESRLHAQRQRDVIDAQRAQIETNRAAQEAVRQQVQRELNERNRLRDEALARKKEFQAEEAALQRQSAAIAARLKARAAAQARPANPAGPAPAPTATPAGNFGPGRLSAPIPGAPITSGFGNRVHPIYGDVRQHTGVDYTAAQGTPIRASGGGVVVSAEAFAGYGNATVIDHGGGIATLYAHQSSMLVAGGQSVSPGQVIGRVGCTGTCTGPHLHFEVRLNGDPVNPVPYLR